MNNFAAHWRTTKYQQKNLIDWREIYWSHFYERTLSHKVLKILKKSDLFSLRNFEEVMNMLLWQFNESLLVSLGCSLLQYQLINSYVLFWYEAVTQIRCCCAKNGFVYYLLI